MPLAAVDIAQTTASELRAKIGTVLSQTFVAPLDAAKMNNRLANIDTWKDDICISVIEDGAWYSGH